MKCKGVKPIMDNKIRLNQAIQEICLILFHVVQTYTAGLKEPSFSSNWVSLEAQNANMSHVTINHNLNEYPAKVDVQVKVTDQGKDYIFTGIGSAHRDDDVDAVYGGVIYIYNNVDIKLYVPVTINGFNTGTAAYTGGSRFTGPATITGKYTACQVRVRAWKLFDLGTPSFVKDSIHVDDSNEVFVDVEHRLGVYPDQVSVQVKMDDGYISDAQGNVFTSPSSQEAAVGGVVFGYDDNNIRLWTAGQMGSSASNGGVFNLHDSWSSSLSADKGVVKVRMWTFSQAKVYSKTFDPFPKGFNNEVEFTNTYSLDHHLVTVEVTAKDGENKNYRFQAAGSCMGDGSGNLGNFGGVIYVYNTQSVLLYHPESSSNGKLVFIGGRWGNGAKSQSSDSASVTVNVFEFGGPLCPIPVDVPDAVQQYSSITEGSTVLYSCKSGFYLSSGNNSLTCTSRSWLGEVPVCSAFQCADPGEVGHATKSMTGRTQGHNVTYTCNTGYTVTAGDSVRTCNANGQWSGSPPICTIITCQNPQIVQGYITCLTGLEYNDQVKTTCNYGYRKTAGDFKRYCTPEGAWNGLKPTCTIIPCKDPGNVVHASRILQGTQVNDKVTYTCNTGYKRTYGDTTRTCRLGGSWTGSRLQCTIIECTDPGDVANAKKTLAGTFPGNKVTYVCNDGFWKASGNLERKCILGGTWDGTAPNCIDVGSVLCADPGTIAEATKNLLGTSPGNAVIYTCKTGFSVSTGNLIRKCQGNGSWDGQAPVCSPAKCPAPENVTNAELNSMGISPGDTATYSCDEGYYLYSGNLVRTCKLDGSWNGSLPVCALIRCPSPPYVPRATFNLEDTLPGKIVTYTCTTGYFASSGNFTHTCSADGKWQGTRPVCSAVQCPDPGQIEHAVRRMTGTSYQTYAMYTCEKFYYKTDGDLTRMCTADGTYSGTPPTCSGNQCPPQVAGNGSYFVAVSNTAGGSAIFGCHKGYVHTAGSTNTTCLPTLQWDSERPTCTLITCQDPDVGVNAIVNVTTKDYGGRANYSCLPGHAITSGDSIRYCFSTNSTNVNGEWTGQAPVCAEYIGVLPSDNFLQLSELNEMVSLLRKELKWLRKNTSSYRMSLVSAKDDRDSALYIGSTGAVVFIITIGLFVLIDITNILNKTKLNRFCRAI